MGAFPSSGNTIRDKDFLPCLPASNGMNEYGPEESTLSDESNISNRHSSSCCLPKMTQNLDTLLIPARSDKNRGRKKMKKKSFLPCMLSSLIKNKMKVAAEDVKKTRVLPVALHAGSSLLKTGVTNGQKKDTHTVTAGKCPGKIPCGKNSKRCGIFRVKGVQNLRDMASNSEAEVTEDESFCDEEQTNSYHVSSPAVPCPRPSPPIDPVQRELEESCIVSEQMYARATWLMYHRIMRFRAKRGIVQKCGEPSSVRNLEEGAHLHPWPSPVELHSSHSYGGVFIMELDE